MDTFEFIFCYFSDAEALQNNAVASQDEIGWTKLHQATYHGLYSQCVDLISRGADVNFADEYGFTPLFVAARRGNEEITKLLCESGANVEHRNYQGKTAMNMAEETDFQNIIAILLNFV